MEWLMRDIGQHFIVGRDRPHQQMYTHNDGCKVVKLDEVITGWGA